MDEKVISMMLMVDDKSSIALSKNLVFHTRSRLIETKFYFY